MLWKRLSLCLLAATCLLSCSPAAFAAEEGERLPVRENASAEEELPAETDPVLEPEEAPEPEVPSEEETEEVDKPFPFLCEAVSDLLETEAHSSYVSATRTVLSAQRENHPGRDRPAFLQPAEGQA